MKLRQIYNYDYLEGKRFFTLPRFNLGAILNITYIFKFFLEPLKKNWKIESKKRGNVFSKLRCIFSGLQSLFIKTKSVLCNIVSISNTERVKTA